MREILLSVVCFHWLATLATGVVVTFDALQRARTRLTRWAFPTQAVCPFPQAVPERQLDQPEAGFSRAA